MITFFKMAGYPPNAIIMEEPMTSPQPDEKAKMMGANNNNNLSVEITLPITVQKDEAAKVWVSYSPNFDLYSQGNTKEEAIEALKLGIETHSRICYERDILFNGLKLTHLYRIKETVKSLQVVGLNRSEVIVTRKSYGDLKTLVGEGE